MRRCSARRVRRGQENALDGAWARQLENAGARVHISRLEALKLQIQQQAEALYGNQLDALDTAVRRVYEDSYYGTAFEVQRGAGVARAMAALDTRRIERVLSRPWTADGQTFRDRCWTNKQALVSSVNTQLTQMIVRGEAPDKAIRAVARQFEVSKAKAGRLVMTESAYFASAAQKDCYGELGVERYKIVAALDRDTCETCGALDGQLFKMSEYQVGATAPPFHPWCRCCTAPYFEDMEELGRRFARDAGGKAVTAPGDMTFSKWKEKFVNGGEKDGLTDVVQRDILNVQKKPENGGSDVHYVGKLDKNIYRCITEDITTDEVIITEERIQHIQERHPNDWERFMKYIPQIVADPDYIIEANKPNAAVILKEIEAGGEKFKLILRLKAKSDPVEYKNSVMSFWHIGDTTWKKSLKNKKILYKKA